MLNEQEKQIVRLLQEGIPLVSRPYAVLAQQVGLSEEELIAKIKDMLARGMIRRLGAAVRHQDLGYVANAMLVFKVPPEEIEAVGLKLARLPEVTHCYQRATCQEWPYNLYVVLHGHSREECRAKAEKVKAVAGNYEHKIIFSVRELKKSSMKYFI